MQVGFVGFEVLTSCTLVKRFHHYTTVARAIFNCSNLLATKMLLRSYPINCSILLGWEVFSWSLFFILMLSLLLFDIYSTLTFYKIENLN